MATMNVAAAGGPVGGGMMVMNNGSPAMPTAMTIELSKKQLNTYIYDYLLRHGHHDIARAVNSDQSFDFNKFDKTSPGRGKNGEMNGDDGSMEKDDAPNDLPRPYGWIGSDGNGFLLEWFNIFFDMFQARSNNKTSPQSLQYMQTEKMNQRQREIAQNASNGRQGVNPAMMRQQMNGVNGMMNKSMTPQQMATMSQRKAQLAAQQAGNQAQQEGDMNGIRTGSPTEGETVGSPSKRPRIENGQQQFNNAMMQNGRAGAVPAGAQQQMLMQSGFNPNMNPQMRPNGVMPPKGVQGQMPAMMMGNASSPMMQGMQQGFPADAAQMEYIRNQQNAAAMAAGQPPMQGNGGQSGNHALQDYQMQLMLLEQQNKKRLMMARQEQHDNNPNGAGPMQGVGMAPGMSPGSRTGTSPNPGTLRDIDRKYVLTKIENMAGRSPAGMNFMGNMPGGDFNPQMFSMEQNKMQMGPGAQGMRPPTSNADMAAMRAQGGRPNQFQGGQPMQQQGSQAGQQIGTPNRDMPPPSAPAGGSAQRNQGGSPANSNAPPTPSTANKPNPKGNKKGAAKEERKRPGKKASNAGANVNDENPPPTPTPSTPVTANNQGPLAKGQGMQGQPHQQQNMGMNPAMQQNDIGFGFNDGTNGDGGQFTLDFGGLENADVLENFDFDSFLNTSADDNLGFDVNGDFAADFGMNQAE